MSKKFFILSFFFIISGSVIFAESLSSAEIAAVQKVMDTRLQTRKFKEADDALKLLKDSRKDFEATSDYKNCGKEAQLIIDNMFVLEIYSYMYQKNLESPELKPYILAQYDKINAYKDAHEGAEFSPYFILSSGDVINSSMQFIPQSTAIKQGLREKDEYDKVVKDNPKLSFGYINRGLWYYFAPAIGGGSKTVAKSDFKNSVDFAACDYERFYSRIYYSQILYDDGQKKECAEMLAECDKILPGNVYTPFIKKLNDNGYSLLYYTVNRSKVDKKLGL